jgi:mono/diheme cytochrome c family protein
VEPPVELVFEDPALIAAGAEFFEANCVACHGIENTGGTFGPACADDVPLGEPGLACESFDTMVEYIPDAAQHTGAATCPDIVCAQSTAAYIIDLAGGFPEVDPIEEPPIEEPPIEEAPIEEPPVVADPWENPDLIVAGAEFFNTTCAACHGIDNGGGLFGPACADDVPLGEPGLACESFDTIVAYIPDGNVHTGADTCDNEDCAQSTAAFIIDIQGGLPGRSIYGSTACDDFVITSKVVNEICSQVNCSELTSLTRFIDENTSCSGNGAFRAAMEIVTKSSL